MTFDHCTGYLLTDLLFFNKLKLSRHYFSRFHDFSISMVCWILVSNVTKISIITDENQENYKHDFCCLARLNSHSIIISQVVKVEQTLFFKISRFLNFNGLLNAVANVTKISIITDKNQENYAVNTTFVVWPS